MVLKKRWRRKKSRECYQKCHQNYFKGSFANKNTGSNGQKRRRFRNLMRSHDICTTLLIRRSRVRAPAPSLFPLEIRIFPTPRLALLPKVSPKLIRKSRPDGLWQLVFPPCRRTFLRATLLSRSHPQTRNTFLLF